MKVYRFSSKKFKEITGVEDLPSWVKEIDGEEVQLGIGVTVGEVLKTGHIVSLEYCEKSNKK